MVVLVGLVRSGEAANQAPFVSNVEVRQTDIDHVLIRYDVAEADGDRVTISLRVSDDGGKTFNVPATKLAGDVGPGISSGTGKEIVWTIGDDIPLHKLGENYVIGVVADDLVGFSERITWEKDGSEMTLVPAGSFEMGDHFNEGQARERPVHRVELDAFYMDVNEVTVGQFKQFVEESGYAYNRWRDVANYSPGDDYPMIYVSWNDATAYCEWVGKRLPTEAEWEYAARGGLIGKRYPWGDEISHDDANWGNTISGKDKWDQCAPVGSFAANGYGLYDMTGNVWEWCSDWYGEGYYATSPNKNPQGPDTSPRGWRVLRGGSWLYGTRHLRVASRFYDYPKLGGNYFFGFRCVSGF